MKKAEQRAINNKVESALSRYNADRFYMGTIGQLNSCKAFMYDTPDYIILKSYRTIVAFIDKRDMVLYDFSRYAYGYTSTTSQYIAKFARKYNIDPENRYTWKEVKQYENNY